MPRRKLALPALLALLALPFAAAPARADDERARRQAAEHFARAEQAERAADWKSAVAEYQAAYALSPHASVLYNIARATDKLGDAVGAADYYQRYLDETSDPADAARVARKIAALRDRAGRALLAEAVKAKGGLARLRAVKGFVARGTFASTIGAEKVEGEFVRTVVGGARARLEKRLPGGKTEVSVVAPAGVWTRSDDRIVVGQDADARAALWRDKDLVLLRTREAGALVQALGTEALEGAEVEYDVVLVARADGSTRTQLYLDRATHLLAAMTFDLGDGHHRVDLSDYREVAGVRFAHRALNTSPGQTLEVVTTALEVNPAVTKGSFDKPKK